MTAKNRFQIWNLHRKIRQLKKKKKFLKIHVITETLPLIIICLEETRFKLFKSEGIKIIL